MQQVGDRQVDTEVLRVESHIAAIAAKLGRPDPVPTLAAIEAFAVRCHERRKSAEVEVPLAVENCSTLPETVAHASADGIDRVRVVRFRAPAGAPPPLEPEACFSVGYLERVRALCEAAAEGTPLVWDVGPAPARGGLAAAQYHDLMGRIDDALSATVPAGAPTAVVSKGDDRMIGLGRIKGLHYPEGEDGGYAWFHPPDGEWAVQHVERLRAAGVGYFVIPATSSWYLDYYTELAQYLRERCSVVFEDADTCRIFELAQ